MFEGFDTIYTGFVAAVVAMILLTLSWLQLRFNKSIITVASIEKLIPHFKKNNPLSASWLECHYRFIVKENSYTGESIIPLDYFVHSASPGSPLLYYDLRIDMPVLFFDGKYFVGEEGIEHFLLEQNRTLFIRFLVRDPSRNFSVEKEKTARESVF